MTLERGWGYGRRVLGLAAALVMSACGVRSTASDFYPELAEHAGRRIDDVRFAATAPFSSDTLLQLVQTQPSRCRFLGVPICVPFTRIGRDEHRLNLSRIRSDVEALSTFYRVAGYFGTRVEPAVERDGDDVDVTFTILRGRPMVLDYLAVTGTEPALDPDSLARRLPLQPGDLFHLGRFIESADMVQGAMQRRGYAYAEVLRSFSADTIDSRAEASIDAIPGPRVTVDSIIVRGANNLGRESALRQVEFQPGDILLSTRLLESQRNLYTLELVSLASVNIAADSLQAAPQDSTTATVVIRISEAPVNEIEAAVGFGTEECLRTEAGWVNRSFGGGARRLAVRGSLARLGVAEPFAIGAGRSICPTEPGDTLFGGDQFDYRFSADFTQPYFLNPRNQLGLNAYAERRSEPGVFSRRAIGGRVGVSRRLGARSGGSVATELELGQTRASPALFCAAFLVCEPATIDSLSEQRFRSELTSNYFINATDNPLEPTSGYLTRVALSYAPTWLGSQVTFFRVTTDGSVFVQPRSRWVFAMSLRLGNFFRTATVDPTIGTFLPPEERFYAGGASTVRGFDRNGLGPGVYVTSSDSVVVDAAGDSSFAREPHFVPTGGTSLAIANAELRLPSPFLSELLRVALFVDAGAIGTRAVWDIGGEDWRVTPGAGVRLQTPVGPVRLDVAYNTYGRPEAPVLWSDVETGRLVRIRESYQPQAGNFFSRLRFHLGVGHAF